MKRLAMWTMVVACVAAGCVKARTLRYYTLSTPPALAQTSAQPVPVTIIVGRLNAPHLLRDDRVVYAMSDVELGVDEYHRWAEPPTGMIERLLVERLRGSHQYKAVQHLSSTTRGDFILRGHLAALNEVDDPAGIKARFSLQLELFDVKAGHVVWNDKYTGDEPVPQKTVTSVVQSLQKSVNAGLDQLSAGLAQYFASHPVQ
ncbi:MAG TPA: ABC-type transport auxiliary lipoprotein family protein [Candidatus Acidoferrum sp.]|nr:ABC-type transport auxiliary lipoprotein family protein [Candidatus Acidoferrum sp.]